MMPLVLIPGVQGRWEYLRPAAEALSAYFQVLTFSLRGETLDDYAAQVVTTLDAQRIERAVICGVSFGGIVALRFAASRPDRTQALVLASTPGPGFHLRPRHDIYARVPWIFGPLFLAETPWRLRREMALALPDRRARWTFHHRALRTLVSAPVSFSRMAARARLIERFDAQTACASVAAPTLVVTGEPQLDFVVPVGGSSDYARLIAGARTAVLERTGHLGALTRPDAFARMVHDFAESTGHAAA